MSDEEIQEFLCEFDRMAREVLCGFAGRGKAARSRVERFRSAHRGAPPALSPRRDLPSGHARLPLVGRQAPAGFARSNTRPAAQVRGGRADYRAVTSFRFPLERIRALRERGEDLAKQELAGAMSQRASCAERLRAMGEQVSGAFAAQRAAAAASTTSPHDLAAHQAYLERMEQVREAGQLDLDRHDAEVDARRDALREAARQRQALERLKDRRRADHDRAVARAEGAVLDEIALTQHRRSAS